MREEIAKAVKDIYWACSGTERRLFIPSKRRYMIRVVGDTAVGEKGIVIKYLTPDGYWWDLEIGDDTYAYFTIIDLWDNRVSLEEITDQIVSCMEEVISKEE